MAKDPRQAAVDAVYAEYGEQVRAAKFAYDAAIRAALEKRNEALGRIAVNQGRKAG